MQRRYAVRFRAIADFVEAWDTEQMLALFAALMSLGQPAPVADLGRTAWIFSTIGQSEFCPAGNVALDLRTGLYRLTPRAPKRVCDEARLERPVSEGILAAGQLQAIRAAYRRVMAEGLMNPVCEDGGRPEEIIVSNGGTPILVLTDGARTMAAPDDLTCWTEAANALHDALDEPFISAHGR